MGARSGMENRLVPTHGYPMRMDPRRRRCAARACVAKLLLPLNLLVAFWQARARIRPHPARRGARHGRLRRVPRRHDGRRSRHGRSRARAERDRRARQPRARRRRRPGRWPAFPRRAGKARSGPATRCARDRRVADARGALRRPQRPAAPARRRRQPRRAGAERPRAAGARAAAGGAARASCTRRARSTSTRCARTTRTPACAPRCVAFIDDMAAALRRGRPGGLPRGRDHGRRAGGRRAWRRPGAVPARVDDHQTANARSSPSAAPRSCCQQRDLTPEKLADLLRGLDARAAARRWRSKARALGKPRRRARRRRARAWSWPR